MHTSIHTIRNKGIVELNGELPDSPLTRWFADDIEVLWVPIFELPRGANALQVAEKLHRKYGDYRILSTLDDFEQVPAGIRGWLIPATTMDSDVICIKSAHGVVEFVSMIHPHTGERMTYQSSRAYDIKHNQNY